MSGRSARCQLLAGHEAAHAVLRRTSDGRTSDSRTSDSRSSDGSTSDGRALARWRRGELSRDIPVGADAATLCLPWAPGMPVCETTGPALEPVTTRVVALPRSVTSIGAAGRRTA